MTRFDSDRHHRRSIRLKEYNYTEAGAYFVTLCTHARECLFGQVAHGVMLINSYGEIARACWLAIPLHFPNVDLDSFVIMPNHVHGIFIITDLARRVAAMPVAAHRVGAHRVGAHRVGAHRVGAQHAAPLPQRPGPEPGSLGAIIRSFKSAVTKQINEERDTAGSPIWQRNYYEHIVRSERELDAIRRYITNNPANWQLDADNPANSSHLLPPATIDDYVRDAGTQGVGK